MNKQFFLLIVFINYSFFLISSVQKSKDLMTTHKYFPEILDQNKKASEYLVYDLLKKNPIHKDINYLAIPWFMLENYCRLDEIPKIKLNNSFTVCHNVNYENIIDKLKSIGVEVLFTTNARNKSYEGIKVLSLPHEARNGIVPNHNKDILYSFVGCNTHEIRNKIFQMEHPKNTVILKRDEFHFAIQDSDKKEKEKIEYQDVLSKSRFSLCPRGAGSGSYRFWESLQAGAIPVLISNDYLLPEGYDWDKCIIRVKEEDIEKIEYIISNISKEQEECMRKNCIEAYKLFSGENLIKVIKDYFYKN